MVLIMLPIGREVVTVHLLVVCSLPRNLLRDITVALFDLDRRIRFSVPLSGRLWLAHRRPGRPLLATRWFLAVAVAGGASSFARCAQRPLEVPPRECSRGPCEARLECEKASGMWSAALLLACL